MSMQTYESANKVTYDELGKKKAAYALNLCTVSVSQIIDYNDVYIMAQEYDAILNNLNLQNYVKDEPILDILKKILDTVNFFTIEEGDKRMIEKQYQLRMKNAIWSAVPNLGILLTGGHPVQIAVTLAAQVGIGYMNYRKNKSQYNLDRELQEWELHKNALIQFHGLRMELFETAWRLSDKYDFDDALRLTPNQIKTYNEILLDEDPLRRYERLQAISGNYEAFPPFWYYLGNAAREASQSEEYRESSESFKQKALDAYKKFDEIYVNFLREDVVAASCALEHIALLDIEKDAREIGQLLDRAIQLGGENYDILQMCIVYYSYLGRHTDAENIMRRLVNENYNLAINGPLLSRNYCKSNRRTEYDILAKRLGELYVLPWFTDEEAANQAEKILLEMSKQRRGDWNARDSWGVNHDADPKKTPNSGRGNNPGKNAFERNIQKEYEKQKSAMQKPNIMVAGGTKVGKSSLINRIFGEKVAEAGAGVSVTKGIVKYENDGLPVVFYDTEGYEVGEGGSENTTNFDNVIKPKIKKMNAGELKDQIHLVWYCIQVAGHKVMPYDIQTIRWFLENDMKVAVVFTKCDMDEELPNGRGKEATILKSVIEEDMEDIKDLSFFETSASREDLSLDLEALLEWSAEALPNDQMRASFVSAQKISVKQKRNIAYGIVSTFAATTAAAAGLNPLPIADTVLIVPQQLAMAVALGKVFLFDSVLETAGNFLKAQLIALAGKQLAASLLKMIPLVGNIVNAGVAGALTFGLGMALTEAYAGAYEEYLETGKLPDWAAIFSSDAFVKDIASYFTQFKHTDKE